MQITLKNAASRCFTQQLTRNNMANYYRQRNILWNQQRFDENWPRYQNYEVHLADKVVGVLRISFAERICYIREIQLLPAYQGSGIGGKLLDWVLERSRQQQLEAVRLSVYTNNPARRLYSRKGFTVKQLHQGMYRMQYRLTDHPNTEPPQSGSSGLLNCPHTY